MMAAPSPLGRLLRAFSWPELRHHGLRHATAVLAVTLGVALAFSVQLINSSALSEFSSAVRSVNGQADLTLRAASGGFAEALYARVAAHPQVALASPVVEVRTRARRPGQNPAQAVSLQILGLDTLVAAPLAPSLMPRQAPQTEVPAKEAGADDGRFTLLQPDAVSLNAAARRTLGVQAGDVIEVQAGLRWQRLRVVGTVSAGGAALGVMDIAGAQQVFAQFGRLQRLDLKLVDGARPADVRTALDLPPGVSADASEDAGERVSNVSRAYRVNLTVLALVALFTGAFLVFSILSLSVAKRQQQFALLGVLGLGARERLQLVLAESALIGVVGSALGLALGTGLAAAALRLLAGDLGGGYFPGIAPTLQWSPGAAALYGGLGIVAALAGGWLPARAAQRLAPAQALKGLGELGGAGRSAWIGPGLLIAGTGMALLPPVGGVPLWAYLAVAAILMGGIACVPAAVGAMLGALPAPRHPAALLAVERARRMRHTATVAIAGVVASLSLSVALTVMVASFRESVTQWLDVVLPADLYARTATSSDHTDTLNLGPALLDGIRALPGVRRAEGVRVVDLRLDPAQPAIALIARPLADPARDLPLVGQAWPSRALQPGEVGAWVSEAMVDLYGARPGTRLLLPLRAGQPPVATRVLGVWRDYARQQGAVVLTESDYQRLTDDRALNDLALWLSPEARTDVLQTRIRALASQQGLDGALLEFAEPRQIREVTLRIFDRSFAVTYWLQAVAIGIGLFGTAASFSAQVLARRKEFGLLGHLGFTRRQILATVAGEGAALTGVGALLGLGLGVAVSVVLVHVVNPQSFHWTMDLMLPGWRLAALCASVVAAGTLTAWLAGRAAAGHDAVMAVKEDW
ncbi:FtsX-like permease family protein [Aquabacterium sp.]|uniref:FtsX-like permease family protein n=1 Tax=Aquabacterium sp. TaxID=1872578 RepID=UPI0035C7694A